MKDIYSFSVMRQDGNMMTLESFRDKVLLIFNSATHCSFTSHYHEIERLYRSYHDQGFEILDFPCNQFAEQTPESDLEINNFCERNYQTTFLRFHKIDVKGDNANPLFLWLSKQRKFHGFDELHPLADVLTLKCIKEDPFFESKPGIKWNFTFFLIGRKGKVVKRFEPTSDFDKIEKAIVKELNKSTY